MPDADRQVINAFIRALRQPEPSVLELLESVAASIGKLPARRRAAALAALRHRLAQAVGDIDQLRKR